MQRHDSNSLRDFQLKNLKRLLAGRDESEAAPIAELHNRTRFDLAKCRKSCSFLRQSVKSVLHCFVNFDLAFERLDACHAVLLNNAFWDSDIPSRFSRLHTPVFGISLTRCKVRTSALFGKQPGCMPNRRIPSEAQVTPASVAAPAAHKISGARPHSSTLLSLGAAHTSTRSTNNV